MESLSTFTQRFLSRWVKPATFKKFSYYVQLFRFNPLWLNNFAVFDENR